MAQERSGRLTGIDVARAVAILLAMTSHVWTVSKVTTFYEGPAVDVMRVAMQTATPTFIILFGTMLQLVYSPRFDSVGEREISLRLLTRGIQCWLLYCLSVLLLFLFHPDYTLLFSLSTMMMMGVTPFTDILKFYAVALTFAPLLLLLERRYGLLPLVLGAIAIHLLHPELRQLSSPAEIGFPKELDRLAMFLFGVGHASMGGPSVLHGLTLVVFGMALGQVLRAAKGKSVHLYWLFGGSMVALLAGSAALGLRAVTKLGTMEPRMESDPAYFAAGLCIASALTAGAVLVTRSGKIGRGLNKVTFLGRTSLFTFAFGNMLLYGVFATPVTGEQSVLLATLLIAIITLLSFSFDRAMQHGGVVSRTVKLTKHMIEKPLGLLANFLPAARTVASKPAKHSTHKNEML